MAKAPEVSSRSKTLMLSFCKNILSDICSQKDQSEDDNQRTIILNVYQEKCSWLIDEISNLGADALSFVVLADLLQKIAQLLLDLTYVEECCLVDQDFLLQSAYERVTNIIETLSSVDSLAVEVAPGNHPRDVLSPSIAECLYWRKGALLYMYCHTVNARCHKQQLPAHFQKCLEDGSRHLVCMLSTRSSPVWLQGSEQGESASSASDTDDGQMLLSQGIYSDTHLLALMYLGEMCYWYAQLTQTAKPALSQQQQQQASLGQQEPDSQPACSPALATTVGEGLATHPAAFDSNTLPEQKDKYEPSSEMEEDSEEASAKDCKTCQSIVKKGRGQQSSGTSMGLRQGDSRDMIRTGQLCLENYVRAAKGPMKAGGWNTNRAEEILQYFEALKI